MFRFLKKDKKIIAESDFLVKSALGVSIVATLILLPFGINDFFNGRMVSGVFVVCMASLCTLNAWLGWRGNYSLALNLIGIIPVITIAFSLRCHQKPTSGSLQRLSAQVSLFSFQTEKYLKRRNN